MAAWEIWTSDDHRDFAVCMKGDQVFRAVTSPGTRYTHVLEVVVRRADANPEKILNEFLEWDTAI